MSIDRNTVLRASHLARIKLAEDRVEPMVKELNAILAWIEQLNEVNVTGVEPMTSVVKMELKRRADKVTEGGKAGDLMKNAPNHEDNFFAVPKVVE